MYHTGRILKCSIIFSLLWAASASAQPEIRCVGQRYVEYNSAGKITVSKARSGTFCDQHPDLDAIQTNVTVEHGMYVTTENPRCGNIESDPKASLSLIVEAIARAMGGDEKTVRDARGALSEVTKACVGKGGDLAKACRAALGIPDVANCAIVTAVTPRPIKGKNYIVQFLANQDDRQGEQCFMGKHGKSGFMLYAENGHLYPEQKGGGCVIAYSRWEDVHASIVKGYLGAGGIYKNWSGDKTRTASLRIWYNGLHAVPPKGKTPPSKAKR